MSIYHVSGGSQRCQKRGLDPWNWSHRWLQASLAEFWEPNTGTLEEQQVLLPTEPSLQPQA